MPDRAPADELLADAQRICAVPAPTFAEAERAALVVRLLEATGVRAELDAVGNVVCRLGGEGPAAVFAAHLDTVFGPEQEIQIVAEDGRIAAPGIGDNSLAVAALVALARRFAERRAAGSGEPSGTRPLARPLVLAATVGEEGLGDLRGAKHLVQTQSCAAFVAVEGMALDRIEVGGVGSERYRATYTGPGGHPWSDRGTASALHGLVTRAAELAALELDDDVVLNIGRVSGGTSINTIAGAAELELDLRARDPAALAALSQRALAVLRDAPAGLSAAVQPVGRRPAGAIDVDHPLVQAARQARAQAGLAPAREGFSSTDANAAYGQGIPAITVGVSTGGNAHRGDEYVEVAPVADGLRALELLADALTATTLQ